MTMETYATLMIILLCWAILLATDLVVSWLLRLVAKVPFRKAFRWGLLSLLVPPVVIAYGTLVERNRFEVKELSWSSTTCRRVLTDIGLSIFQTFMPNPSASARSRCRRRWA